MLIMGGGSTGLPYFYDPVRRVVTEANIRALAIITAVNAAVEYVLAKYAEMSGTDWSLLNADLYVQVNEVERICRYYFVDHTKRTLFWLVEVTTDEIGLPKTTSLDTASKYDVDREVSH